MEMQDITRECVTMHWRLQLNDIVLIHRGSWSSENVVVGRVSIRQFLAWRSG